MREEIGNLWDFAESHALVIPTNIGWKITNGHNVMGRGLVADASLHYPWLAEHYGLICRNYGAATPVLYYRLDGKQLASVETSMFRPCIGKGMFLFPVKPLLEGSPHLSWQQDASLTLIERSLCQLRDRFPGVLRIAIPLVGCGNGRLQEAEVAPKIVEYLGDRATAILVRPRRTQ